MMGRNLARLIALALGAVYLSSAWGFISGHSISFIHYAATEPLPQWVVANLGARLFAIGAGMVAAAVIGERRLLLLALAVRLLADATDTAISATTPGLPGFVVPVLLTFVAIEMLALILAARAKPCRKAVGGIADAQ